MSKNNASYEAVEKVVDTTVDSKDKEKEISKFSKLIICTFVKKNKDFLEDTIIKTCEIFNDFAKLDLIDQKKLNLKEQLQLIKLKKKCENIAINEICEIIKNGVVDSDNATNDTIDLLDAIIEIRKSVFERVISNNSDMEEEYVMMNKKILMQLDNTREILHNSKWFLRKLIDSPISQAIFYPVYKSILSAWNNKDPELIISIPEMYGIDMNDIINLIKQIKTIADKNEK